jgi:hypothetical protein
MRKVTVSVTGYNLVYCTGKVPGVRTTVCLHIYDRESYHSLILVCQLHDVTYQNKSLLKLNTLKTEIIHKMYSSGEGRSVLHRARVLL